MIDTLKLIGRKKNIFFKDLDLLNNDLNYLIKNSKILVIGGAGSIGQSTVKELFKRSPKTLHVVDISENNLVELVRDIRSSYGYNVDDFKTFALDCGSIEFEKFLEHYNKYDYVFNFSALKHVRSEKDPFTLMRMIEVNILNTIKITNLFKKKKIKNFFCVSTDKAANPANLMGASKRIMEMYLMKISNDININMARFANVAFSDASLLYGFDLRIKKNQPISAPKNIFRYFIVDKEATILCLLSSFFGQSREIFFPNPKKKLKPISFSNIAENYLNEIGYKPDYCSSENEARIKMKNIKNKKWPCYFFSSNTTGEKKLEEFYTFDEKINLNKFNEIGIVKCNLNVNEKKLDFFLKRILKIKNQKKNILNKEEIIEAYNILLPNLKHIELNKNLDQIM